jgi:predicted neutral ceramidase superfamily lipid hydrolase
MLQPAAAAAAAALPVFAPPPVLSTGGVTVVRFANTMVILASLEEEATSDIRIGTWIAASKHGKYVETQVLLGDRENVYAQLVARRVFDWLNGEEASTKRVNGEQQSNDDEEEENAAAAAAAATSNNKATTQVLLGLNQPLNDEASAQIIVNRIAESMLGVNVV